MNTQQLLEYLIQVAQKTGGSEVWRALFAQMLASLKEGKPLA